jgi:hypothetical protein
MGVVACLASLGLWFLASKDHSTQTTGREGQVKLKNPFSLGPAISFAVFFVFIILVSKVARNYWGDAGLYFAAAFSGLADVDAITLYRHDYRWPCFWKTGSCLSRRIGSCRAAAGLGRHRSLEVKQVMQRQVLFKGFLFVS